MILDSSDTDLIAQISPEEHARHGIPEPETVARHEAAYSAAEELLAAFLLPRGIKVSPLGPGWSRDLDLHVVTLPPPQLLLDSGWLPLDLLLQQLGSKGEGRWAIVASGLVLAQGDLTTAPPPDPLSAVRRRAARRGQVRLRETLELRVLQRSGVVLPAQDAVVQAAAALESALGGDELRQFLVPSTSPQKRGPISIRSRADPVRRSVATLRRLVGRRIVVGVSGVDGSGKSSLTTRLAGDLAAAGVTASIVWTRPGMRLKTLAAAARLAHRLFRLGPAPSIRSVAGGESDLVSRRGTMGGLWAVAVSIAFAVDVRRRHMTSRGVVLYDRHLPDALVTLDFVYAGVDLRLARWIIRRAVPRAALSFYVDVPYDVALSRKPGDTFGEHAVRRQLDAYASRQHEFPGLIVLDGRRSPDELRIEALRHLTGSAVAGQTPAGP